MSYENVIDFDSLTLFDCIVLSFNGFDIEINDGRIFDVTYKTKRGEIL